ncbi:MAG: hypothetical protein WC374_04300 [Phycisphaerae bacterium]|jgi:hypothetical protein
MSNKNQKESVPKIGIAKETVYGKGNPRVSDIIFTGSAETSREIKGEKMLDITADATFSCPCCGNKLNIQIKKSVKIDK